MFKTGELADSVQHETLANYGRVYSDYRLATVHEYGVVTRKAVIPARPIRREIARDEGVRIKIKDIVGMDIKLVFSG